MEACLDRAVKCLDWLEALHDRIFWWLTWHRFVWFFAVWLVAGAVEIIVLVSLKDPWVVIPCQMETHDLLLKYCLADGSDPLSWQCEPFARIAAIMLPCHSVNATDVEAWLAEAARNKTEYAYTRN